MEDIRKSIFDLQDEVIEKAETQVREYERTRRGKREHVGAYSRSWAQVAKERKEKAKKEGREVSEETTGAKGEDKFRVPAVPPLKGLKVDEYRELLKQGHTWREIKAFGTSDAARAKIGEGKKEGVKETKPVGKEGGPKISMPGEGKQLETSRIQSEKLKEVPEELKAEEREAKRKELEGEKPLGEEEEGPPLSKEEREKKYQEMVAEHKGGGATRKKEEREKEEYWKKLGAGVSEREAVESMPEEFKDTHKVGKTVRVGNKDMKILAIGPRGFTAEDEKGTHRRIQWKSISGFGNPEQPAEKEEYKEPELTRKETKVMSKYNRKVLSQRMDEAYNNLDKIKAAKEKIKTSGYSKEEVKELKAGLANAQKQVKDYLDNLIATTPKMEIYRVSISKLMSKVSELIKVLVRRTNVKAGKGDASSAKYKGQAQGLLSKFVEWMKGLVGKGKGKGKFEFSEDQRAYAKRKLEEISKEREAGKPEATVARKQKFEEGRKKGMEKLKAAREEKKKKTEGWSKEKITEVEEKRKAGYKKYKTGKKTGEAPELKEKSAPEPTKAITKEEVLGLKKRGYNNEEIKKLGEQGAKAAYWNKISPEDSGVREKKGEPKEKKTTGKAKAEEIASKRKEGYAKWQAAKKKQKGVVKKSLSWQDIAKQEQRVLVKKAVGGKINVEEEKMLSNIARQRREVFTTPEERMRPSERKMLRDIKANVIMLKPEWQRKRKGKLEIVHRRKNIILRRPKQGKIPEA